MSLSSLKRRASGSSSTRKPAETDAAIASPVSAQTKEFRGLRHSIERLHRNAGTKVIVVSSAAPGDGKSVTTLNLAASLAESSGTRVLIVDADLHKASISGYLGLARDTGPGLSNLLDQSAPALADVVRRVDGIDLSIVFAGARHPRPFELLSSPRLDHLLAEMRERYDYVLVDTPPIVPVADGRALSRSADGVLMVVRAHQTPRRKVIEALGLLDRSAVLGLVLNGHDRLMHEYEKYYELYGSTAARADKSRLSVTGP
jgi:capsular exopolysaccharide synthesis family protein